jgi:small-conductance mechanosensitive channel
LAFTVAEGYSALARRRRLLVARLLGRLLTHVLRRVWVDGWAERRSLAKLIRRPIRIGVAVVVVFAVLSLVGLQVRITAAAQTAVSAAILMVLVGIVVAAAAATFAPAFGSGGPEVARQRSAGRYVRAAFASGMRISFGEISGEIVTIETAATVLRADQGRTVRVPNNLLLESVVTVHEPSGGQGPERG